MSQTAKSCRAHAEECRELARRMPDPVHRTMMADIVQAWETMAKAKAKIEAARDDEGLC